MRFAIGLFGLGVMLAATCGAASTKLKPATFEVPPEYSAGIPSQPYGYSAAGPTPALTTDLNHDGFGDFVTVDYTSGTAVVVLGGSHGFQPPASFTAVPHPVSVASGDFNKDGNADLIVVGDTAVLLLGNGNGTFQAPVAVFPAIATYVAVGDFNGDGNPDIALAGANQLLTLLGNGNGTFQSYVATPLANPWGLYAGDFHNNARDDLLVEQRKAPVILLSSNGDGTFTAGPPLFNLFGQLTIADMNNDGNLDIVTVAVDVWLGDGQGHFHRVASQRDPLGADGIAVADVNGDGIPDVVTSDQASAVSIFFGLGGGQLHAPYSYTANTFPLWLGVGTFTTSGRPDVLVLNTGGYSIQAPTLSVLRNIGSGTFAGLPNLSLPNGGAFTLGDMNQDGILDLVATNNGSAAQPLLWILPGLGNGAFAAPTTTITLPGTVISVAVADFDGDGSPDFAVVAVSGASTVLEVGLQQSPNQFTLFSTALSQQATIAWAGDLNGDGLPDLVLLSTCAGGGCTSVYTLLNTGNGTFGSLLPVTGSFGYAVAVADFNNDGKPDLALSAVTGCGKQDGSAVLLGNGDGSFGTPICLTGSNNSLVAAGDFNGDGNQDVALVESTLLVFLGDGKGGFHALPSQTLQPGGATQILAADFNGDGHTDLAAMNAALLIYLGNGAGTFTFDQLTYEDAGLYNFYASTLAGDLNNDGKIDVVTFGGDTVSVLLNTTRQRQTSAYPAK